MSARFEQKPLGQKCVTFGPEMNDVIYPFDEVLDVD